MIPIRHKNAISVGGFFKVRHLLKIGSTNDFLKSLSTDESRENFVVVADEQTKGKGRLSRKFFSPKGGLYFSILIRPNDEAVLNSLTALAAICVCDAVEKVCGDSASVKWVNDVLIGDKKCSGILVETTENLKGFAIVGIGVNIGDGKVDESIKDIACGVTKNGRDTKWKLLAAILENFKNLCTNFDRKKIADEYKARCSTVGKRVRVVPNDGNEYFAVAEALDDDLRLVVRDDNGDVRSLYSGEVRIVF